MADTTDNVVSISHSNMSKEDEGRELRRLAAMDPIAYDQARIDAHKAMGIRLTTLDRKVEALRRNPDTFVIPWDLDTKGAIKPSFSNACVALRNFGFNLRFNEFDAAPYYDGHSLTAEDALTILEQVQNLGCGVRRGELEDAILRVSSENKFHEVRDWLDELEWDGIERIETLLIDHAGADDTQLNRTWTRQFMIQAVARIYEPGCKADSMLILEGQQGVGKSTLLQVLFGKQWFTDRLSDLHSKDAAQELLGVWCVEIAELSTTSRSDTAMQKAFLSRPFDRLRLPYDRGMSKFQRQCVFAGTTNDHAYLKDETGARRFCPISVKDVDTGAIERGREQYWAEAVHWYKQGEKWHLTEGDVADAAKEAQRNRYQGDIWTEEIEQWISGKPFVSMADILRDCIGLQSKADWSQREENRVARVLNHLGWKRKQRRSGGVKSWVYVPQLKDEANVTLEDYADSNSQQESEW